MRKCPHCQMEIDPKATRCPHCQSDLRSNTWIRNHPILSLIGAIILLGIFINVFSSISKNNSTNQNQSAVSLTKEVQTLNIGDEGFLRSRTKDKNGKDSDVLLATTKKSFDAFMQASVAHDNIGAAKIILEGGAYYVTSGTKALIIDSDNTGGREVRVLDGEKNGNTGWTPMEFIVSK